MSYCDENGCLNRNRQLIGDDDLEFLRKQLKNIEYYKLGYNAAQKTLFTEEEIIRAMEFARGHHKMTDTQFLETLKNKL